MWESTFRKDMLKFYLAIGSWLSAFLVQEYLHYPYSITHDLILEIFLLVPIYLAFVWGGCWNILPEFMRIQQGASYNPPVRRVESLMLTGFWILVIIFGVSSMYSIVWGVFQIRLAYPPLMSYIVRAISTAGVSSIAVAVIVSKRMQYQTYWDRPRPWSVSRILRASGFGTLFIGLWTAFLFPVEGLILILAGAIMFPVGTVVRHRSVRDIAPAAPVRALADKKAGPVDNSQNENRMSIAKQISDLIVKKNEKRVLLVCMWGVGSDDAWLYPEIDLLTVLRGGERAQSKSYNYHGFSVRISYWEEAALLYSAGRVDDDWAKHSSYFRVRKVLFERDGWSRNLEKALQQSDKTNSTEALRELVLDLSKYLSYLRVDKREGDLGDVVDDGREIAELAVSTVYLLDRRYCTNSFWKDVYECPSQPPGFRALVETAAGFSPASQQELAKAAEELAEKMLEMVKLKGISIDSSELTI